MVRAYYKADKLRKQRQDEAAWMTGLYVLNALDATVGNMFRKTGQTPVEYPEEPFTITRERERKKAKEQQTREREKVFALAWMTSFVQAGKNWGKNKER